MQHRRQRRPHLDAALVALVTGPVSARTLTRLDVHDMELADHAVRHGLPGLAHQHVRHLVLERPELVEALDEARREAWADHLTKTSDLVETAAALSSLDGPWAVVKGPVLVERTYGRADLRRYHDIDLLVHPRAYGQALTLLEAAGAVLLDRNWQLIRSSSRAELSLQLHGRTTIDLHSHLLTEAEVRSSASWAMGPLLHRAQPAQVGRALVPVLDPVDALLHLAVHATLSGGHRLVWLKDLQLQQSAWPVDMALVKSRAEEAGLWPAVHLALLRAARTFGEPAPAWPPLWSRVNSAVGTDRFRTAGWAGDGRTLAGATRRSVVSSFRSLVQTALRDQFHPWLRSRGLTRWVPPPPPSLKDLRRRGGSQADREAYLRTVAEWC